MKKHGEFRQLASGLILWGEAQTVKDPTHYQGPCSNPSFPFTTHKNLCNLSSLVLCSSHIVTSRLIFQTLSPPPPYFVHALHSLFSLTS